MNIYKMRYHSLKQHLHDLNTDIYDVDSHHRNARSASISHIIFNLPSSFNSPIDSSSNKINLLSHKRSLSRSAQSIKLSPIQNKIQSFSRKHGKTFFDKAIKLDPKFSTLLNFNKGITSDSFDFEHNSGTLYRVQYVPVITYFDHLKSITWSWIKNPFLFTSSRDKILALENVIKTSHAFPIFNHTGITNIDIHTKQGFANVDSLLLIFAYFLKGVTYFSIQFRGVRDNPIYREFENSDIYFIVTNMRVIN